MSRTFAYVRVSTHGQTTENQIGEIKAAGFDVHARRVVSETVSGSVATKEREGFTRLLDRMEEGDILVVTKMDRLGRNAMDVRTTVETLAAMGVKVHCLALGGVDLTSSTGRMTMSVINAVAEFERDLLIERTHAGLIRAKEQGKVLGRPRSLTDAQKHVVREKLGEGASVSKLSRDYGVSRQTIQRARDEVRGQDEPDGGVETSAAHP
ncbi:resolvase [Aureimonas ureilytica]|uniref:Resolvase n=1 Tax=Aureimonas ureilytica TaxID=401562 RepID=A0A175RTB7_9HYPH|nr:recombinase family protein [Aureimonas ureilytica]KTR07065.1 resolvase [Aureimonas ureilytica]